MKHSGNFFKNVVFSKEVIAAVLGVVVLLFGYTYNSNKQQDLERFKIKADAYSEFIRLFASSDLNNINQTNQALLNLYLYAPDCVIKELNHSMSFSGGQAHFSGLEGLQAVGLILHEDMSNKLKCSAKEFIKKDDLFFMVGKENIKFIPEQK